MICGMTFSIGVFLGFVAGFGIAIYITSKYIDELDKQKNKGDLDEYK